MSQEIDFLAVEMESFSKSKAESSHPLEDC
jgi:hypothetical protein